MCNKKTFKGSINGCQYTDKNEFIKALKQTDLNQSVSIQCNEYEENVEIPDYFDDFEKITKDFQEIRSFLLGDAGKSFFDSFFDFYDKLIGTEKETTGNTNNTENECLEDKCPDGCSECECECECQEKTIKDPDEDDFIKTYITDPCEAFTEPVNTNTLRSVSEDRVIEILQRLANSFDNELSILPPNTKDKIVKAYIDASKTLENTVPSIDITILDIKASLEKLEKITTYYNELNMEVPLNISDKRKELGKELEQLYVYVNNLKYLSNYYSLIEEKLSI